MQSPQGVVYPVTMGWLPRRPLTLNPRGVQNKWDATCIDRELGVGRSWAVVQLQPGEVGERTRLPWAERWLRWFGGAALLLSVFTSRCLSREMVLAKNRPR
jgi:hypothetical protein